MKITNLGVIYKSIVNVYVKILAVKIYCGILIKL